MRIAFYTLGCKLNQAETESLVSQIRQAGYQLIASNATADVYIANTCTVTHIADRKSRHWLRLVRKRNPHAFIIVTGCYAQRAPQELVSLADLVLGNEEKERLPEIIKDLALQISSFPMARNPSTIFSDGITRVRSLVKIQDGCQTPCSYCIVPQVRPHEYSLPATRIIEEIKNKVALGYKEVVLTGTNVGYYRNDGIALSDLIRRILSETGIERLRLSSLQPQEISPGLIALWQDAILSTSEGTRLCRHFHLALQSGSETVLQRMKRRYSLDDYVKAISSIKEAVPEVAITTDIMVGFPGESDKEFEQSYHFCQEAGFANIHVFPFSPRPATQAARMSNQAKGQQRRERIQQMLELAQNCRHSFWQQFLGQNMWVLWEKETSPGSNIYSGLTDNYIRVFARSEKPLTNKIAPARLIKVHNHGMWGELVRI